MMETYLCVFAEDVNGDEPPYYCGCLRGKSADQHKALADGVGNTVAGLLSDLFDGTVSEATIRLTAKRMTQEDIDEIPEV